MAGERLVRQNGASWEVDLKTGGRSVPKIGGRSVPKIGGRWDFEVGSINTNYINNISSYINSITTQPGSAVYSTQCKWQLVNYWSVCFSMYNL